MNWHTSRSALAPGGVSRSRGRHGRNRGNRRNLCGAVAIAVAITAGLAGRAAAEPVRPPATGSLTADGTPGRRVAVDTPLARYIQPLAQASPTIYLNRCTGGCAVHMGTNDAHTNTSSIPTKAESTVGEFAAASGDTGAAADDEWRQLVNCITEVYSPFNVVITDARPTSGVNYHEAIIAGQPGDIGLPPDILGVAPLASNCSAIDNVISFSFANHHNGSGVDRVLNICWTAAQESAHAFGLDHEYSFVDGNRSACNDPMTYRNDCGGEKFFRNEAANCGETATRACKCGTSQNSHAKLAGVFGAGHPVTGNPTVALTSPAPGSLTLGGSVTLQAGAKRGVARVELYFNDFKWAEVGGAAFGPRGQVDPSTYVMQVPPALPNSVVDVKAIAYDDLGAATTSTVVTVTKGAPCQSAAACTQGQKCEAGKCFWGPPSGEIGDSCSFAEFCKGGLCTGTAEQKICTKTCSPGVADTCPQGFDCVMSGDNTGVCFFTSSGGCCSVGRGDDLWWAHVGVGAAVLGFVLRRRRR